MGGFCCSGASELGPQISFNENSESKKLKMSNRQIIKDSFNNFLTNFNKKKEKVGDYITKDKFYSIMPAEIQNYKKENPLNINQENLKT